ncbi:hypothetical protein RBSH_05940 [Rhodopirellula baltica SH28]|uniref:Clan AA aspartic protease n=1 Tax=Rhodopirellula baltica SH28 TaxID=993517 RepID=K5D8J2_RHOBT|nr:clan AA aspartic protease [Rhodopirellula baltica]EKJ98747.1 hypothetical protein RBSH_05940 [Rhodopirellula baltica SH28]
MIEGRIDNNVEAFVDLEIQLDDTTHAIAFLVDTGFNGFLSIPFRLVHQLGLPLSDVQQGVTADGRSSFFDTVELTVIWHGNPLTVQAQVLDEPLLGTRLLRGSKIEAAWIQGGMFQIELILDG